MSKQLKILKRQMVAVVAVIALLLGALVASLLYIYPNIRAAHQANLAAEQVTLPTTLHLVSTSQRNGNPFSQNFLSRRYDKTKVYTTTANRQALFEQIKAAYTSAGDHVGIPQSGALLQATTNDNKVLFIVIFYPAQADQPVQQVKVSQQVAL